MGETRQRLGQRAESRKSMELRRSGRKPGQKQNKPVSALLVPGPTRMSHSQLMNSLSVHMRRKAENVSPDYKTISAIQEVAYMEKQLDLKSPFKCPVLF